MPARPVRRGIGLGTKFFVAAGLLLAAALGAAIAFATWRANQVAEKSIRDALGKVPRMVASSEMELADQVGRTVHSLAEEPRTKAILGAESNAETYWEWTRDQKKVLGEGARTVFLFDPQGALLARSDKAAGEGAGQSYRNVRWVAEAIAPEQPKDSSGAIREQTALALVAASPVVQGDRKLHEERLNGVVAVAFDYDLPRAEAIRAITGGQVAFLADTSRRGEKPQPALSVNTPGFPGEAVIAKLRAGGPDLDTLCRKGQEIGPLDIPVPGDVRVIKAVPIKSASGETIGAVVVARSRAEETAAFREIRRALLLIGLVALVFSLPVSLVMGRGIARPLQQLARGAEAIREGQLDVALPEAGRDEVGALARAFRGMVVELKEKAALEEMVAAMGRPEAAPAKDPGATVSGVVPSPGATGPVIGRVFSGRYEVLATLGRGGMGTVYRAMDRELDDEVALKVLTPVSLEDGTLAVQTLKSEIRLARKITHPNVVRTHDLGEFEGVRFLTMEYVPGTTLREVVDRKGPIALGPGLQISKQLCRGLSAVHEAGIIHRDIKPQNVMVLPNGVVKLMDFGIARTADSGEGAVAREQQTVGTPYYMSPEQAQGLALDPRSDIYSVGVVLYELFAGTRPITGKTMVDVMKAHVGTPPRPIAELRPDLPSSLARILMACLAKSPDRRPPSANDLYGALMRVEV
jgi:serine/threonine-protein kinase